MFLQSRKGIILSCSLKQVKRRKIKTSKQQQKKDAGISIPNPAQVTGWGTKGLLFMTTYFKDPEVHRRVR